MIRFLLILCFLCICNGVHAQSSLPRFASLRSNEINLRTGPGERFPIEWVYRRVSLPVEIIDEFEHWRKIRDIDNTTGWVHKKMLSGKRTALTLKNKQHTLYKKETIASRPLAYIDGQIIVTLEKCRPESAFCKVSFQKISGYLIKDDLWGVYEEETID